MTPCRGNNILFCSSSNSLVSVPWRAFWADTAPFKGPQPYLIGHFWNHRGAQRPHQVFYVGCGPESHQEQLTYYTLIESLIMKMIGYKQAFLCGIHPSPCKENAGQGSFGVLKTSFSIVKTSFTCIFENKFVHFWKEVLDLCLKNCRFLPFSNKNC